MPWLQVTLMSQRKEFAQLAMVDGANMARLCRSFNISRKTGYKWLARYLREGEAGLRDRSRRPRASPWLTPPALEEAVLALRPCLQPARSPPFCTARAASTRKHR
ncbi:MAG: leucine zipper domain-containing protein [Thermodesulfobacteriota bacterium]